MSSFHSTEHFWRHGESERSYYNHDDDHNKGYYNPPSDHYNGNSFESEKSYSQALIYNNSDHIQRFNENIVDNSDARIMNEQLIFNIDCNNSHLPLQHFIIGLIAYNKTENSFWLLDRNPPHRPSARITLDMSFLTSLVKLIDPCPRYNTIAYLVFNPTDQNIWVSRLCPSHELIRIFGSEFSLNSTEKSQIIQLPGTPSSDLVSIPIHTEINLIKPLPSIIIPNPIEIDSVIPLSTEINSRQSVSTDIFTSSTVPEREISEDSPLSVKIEHTSIFQGIEDDNSILPVTFGPINISSLSQISFQKLSSQSHDGGKSPLNIVKSFHSSLTRLNSSITYSSEEEYNILQQINNEDMTEWIESCCSINKSKITYTNMLYSSFDGRYPDKFKSKKKFFECFLKLVDLHRQLLLINFELYSDKYFSQLSLLNPSSFKEEFCGGIDLLEGYIPMHFTKRVYNYIPYKVYESKIRDNLMIKLAELGENPIKEEPCGVYGNCDILTNSSIIEVKRWALYKHAFGQIMFYSAAYPTKQRRIHFFDRNNMTDIKHNIIIQYLFKFNILVTWEEE